MTLPKLVIPAQPDNTEPRATILCSECSQDTFPPYAHRTNEGDWHIPASGGGFYELLKDAKGDWACSCPGFHFRGRCRHVHGSVEHPGVYVMEAEFLKGHKSSKPKPAVRLEDLFG